MSVRYTSGKYTAFEQRQNIKQIEQWITNEFLTRGPITTVVDQRDMNRRLEEVTGGKNVVRFDDQGNPSIMVVIPFKSLSDVGLSGGLAHSAFIVNGNQKSQIEVSKYPNIVVGAGATQRALSLRFRDPAAYITFDQSIAACKQKGAGWHLLTNAEWALLALLSKANGFMPRGNTNYGKSSDKSSEVGNVSYRYQSTNVWYNGRTDTGSGPFTWAHDGTEMGVYDLCGNVYEWVGGMRLNAGEIQVIPDNNAADNTVDQTAASTAWQAVSLTDGSFVAPGTAGTAKYDSINAGTTGNVGAPQINSIIVNSNAPASGDDGSTSTAFEQLIAASGITVPQKLKELSLAPLDSSHGGDSIYIRNYGERLPFRGGYWGNGSSAGVFCMNLGNPRSGSSGSVGFRSAFVL